MIKVHKIFIKPRDINEFSQIKIVKIVLDSELSR